MHLGERLGEDAVAAHHGSLSRERRHRAEQRLKAGELKVVVATASLELGIDVGAVDLVLPHRLAAVDRDRAAARRPLGPRAAAPRRRAGSSRSRATSWSSARRWCARPRAGRDRRASALRDAPLDVLAQQIVAACACEEWDEDALFELVRRGGAVRRPGARRLRRGGRHAVRGHRHQPRARGRAPPPRRGQPAAARAARRAARRAHLGRRDPRQRQLRRRARARGRR